MRRMLPSLGTTTGPATAVTVFAALGPNPAPLTELIWALHRQRSLLVTDLFLVMDKHCNDRLHWELLDDGGGLHELWLLLGFVPSATTIRERIVQAPSDTALDDEDPAHADLYNAAIWDAARDATAHAGSGVVVFGLTAGRRRTMTAMSSMAFQLLSRPQDLCLDVRVSEKRAEGGSGFYFPEQRRQAIAPNVGAVFHARDVEVRLVNVVLPRLRELVPGDMLATYASALAASQAAVDAAALPRLIVDLAKGEVKVDVVVLELSPSEFIWYAALALARRDGEGWIAAADLVALRSIADACSAKGWTDKVESDPIRALLGIDLKTKTVTKKGKQSKKDQQPYANDLDLAHELPKLKSDTLKRVKNWCAKNRASCAKLLTPQVKRSHVDGSLTFHQRLELPSDRIEIVGLP